MIVSCPSCQTRYNLDDLDLDSLGTRMVCEQCDTTFLVRSRPQITSSEEEDDDIATDNQGDLRSLLDEDEDDLDTDDGEVASDEDEDDFETVIETSAVLNAFIEDLEKQKSDDNPDTIVRPSEGLRLTLRKPEASTQSYTIGDEDEDEEEDDDWDTDIGDLPITDDSSQETSTPSKMSLAFITENDEDDDWNDEDVDDEDSADSPTDAWSTDHVEGVVGTFSEPKAATLSQARDGEPDANPESDGDDASDEEIVHNSHPLEPGLLPRPKPKPSPPETSNATRISKMGLVLILIILAVLIGLIYYFYQSGIAGPVSTIQGTNETTFATGGTPQKEAEKPTEVGIQSADEGLKPSSTR